MRIFEHNFVADKAKIRRRAVARQGFLTQSAAKFAEKTYAYAYEDRFSAQIYIFFCISPPFRGLGGGQKIKNMYNKNYRTLHIHIIIALKVI